MPHVVSVIAPCCNEHEHVSAFVAAVCAQQLPAGWQLELLVADGASDDGTRQALATLAAAEARLRVLDNPRRIVSCGLNLAIAAASGSVLVRMDLHTRYAGDYIAQCLAALERSGADNVGGPWRAAGDTPWQCAIAAAFQSRWVAGGARSRQVDYEGPADTVYLGAWPRASFERWGGFDETLVRNQDDEHNLRIVKGGGRVWQSALIHSRYSPRRSPGALWRQWLQYGYWKPFVMKKHGQSAALRHLVPGAYVAIALGLAGATLAGLPWPCLAGWLGAYALLLLALSAAVAAGAQVLAWRLPVVIAAQQLGYGWGSLVGWWDVLVHGAPRARYMRLTR